MRAFRKVIGRKKRKISTISYPIIIYATATPHPTPPRRAIYQHINKLVQHAAQGCLDVTSVIAELMRYPDVLQ